MPQNNEYKIIQGNGQTVSSQITTSALLGWRPILMSACVGATPTAQVQIVVIMELIRG